MSVFRHIKRWYPKSFATRLSLSVISLAVIVFTVIMSIFYHYVKTKITERAIQQTDLMLLDRVSYIIDELHDVKTAVTNMVWVVLQNEENGEPVAKIPFSVVRHNTSISGSAVAYSSGSNAGLMWYALRENGQVRAKMLKEQDYNFVDMEWFKVPSHTKKEHFSEPYFDDGAGDMLLCTYSLPLLDTESGQPYGVVTADMSLSQIGESLERMHIHPSCLSLLVSTQNKLLASSATDSIGYNFILEFTNFPSRYGKDACALAAGKTKHAYIEEIDSYVFRNVVADAGWVIWNIYPKPAMIAEVNDPLYIIFLMAVVGIILIFLTIYYAIRGLSTPLTCFARSAKEIATGRFDVHLPEAGSIAEITDLRNAFEQMQKSLAAYIEELKASTAATERIEQELSIAREIQQGMLPKPFSAVNPYVEIDLKATLHPVKEVGGDLYDFFVIDHKLYLFIGDVSGKGIPAALFMAVTRSILRTIIASELTPEECIRRMNSAIATFNDAEMFVTCFLGMLDMKNGRLDFCNAGHNSPAMIAPDGTVRFLDVESNVAMGLLDDFAFAGQSIHFGCGDRIVLYTDGVVEAENRQRVLYSDERLIQVLSEHTDNNSQGLIDTIEASVTAHADGAPQSDDLAILVLGCNHLTQQHPYTAESFFDNELEQTPRIETLVSTLCEDLQLTSNVGGDIRLALEEAIVNIISYGYEKGQRDRISVKMESNGRQLTFTITDSGKPFDPTQTPEPDLDIPLEDSLVGGLGIFLVRNIMDEVSYLRIGDKNQLTLKKTII